MSTTPPKRVRADKRSSLGLTTLLRKERMIGWSFAMDRLARDNVRRSPTLALRAPCLSSGTPDSTVESSRAGWAGFRMAGLSH